MSIQQDYIPLVYGIDEASGRQNPQKGRLIGVENYEIVSGEQGLRRINGYERFDGQALASAATYTLLYFDTGTSEISVGDTVTTAGGSGHVLRVQLDAGSWSGGDAEGVLILTAVTGAFAASEAISVGTPKAVVVDSDEGAVDDAAYATDIVLARDYYRNLIAKPVGEGAILGVALFDGVAYCLRNVVGSRTATLWKQSAAGWTAVRTGLRPGGSMRTVKANFTGATGTNALYGCDGKTRHWSYDGTTFTFAPSVFPTDLKVGKGGSPGTAFAPSSGAVSLAVTADANERTWTTATEVIVYAIDNAASYMIGTPSADVTIAAAATATVTLNVTSFYNAGAYDYYHVARTDGLDRPRDIAEHRNYLFLVYPQGQMQTSDVGEPMKFEGTTTAFGMGDEIAAVCSLKGDVLGIFGSNRVSVLYGDGSAEIPFDMKRHSDVSNVRAGSAMNVGGDAVYLADAGIMTLAGSQEFGDFSSGSVSIPVRRSIADIAADYKCASLIKSDAQYRIYGRDKQTLVMSFAGGVIRPKTVQFTRLYYEHQAVCVATETANGEEIVIFGTDDGWVMRERSGTTFDGTDISAFFRTSYWHHGSQQQKKRWRKLTLDVDCGNDAVDLQFHQDIDFQNGVEESTPYTAQITGSGGMYDATYWDTFFFDTDDAGQVHAQVDGVGRFMSIIFSTTGDHAPHFIRGIHYLYSPLGGAR